MKHYENREPYHRIDDEHHIGFYRYHREDTEKNKGIKDKARSHQYPEYAHNDGRDCQ